MPHPSHVMWTEKYRPVTFDDYVFPSASLRAEFMSLKQDGSFQHLLLSGPPGCGKTTLVGILINELEFDPVDVVRINCSDERGIDTFRDKIQANATVASVGSTHRVFHLEEADALTSAAQEALRAFMEEYSNNIRFVLTCNNVSKITDRLQSRCRRFVFPALSSKKIFARAVAILDGEGVQFSPEDLMTMASRVGGDMRQMIIQLQDACRTGTLVVGNTEPSVAGEYDGVITALKKGDWQHAIQLSMRLAAVDDWPALYTYLYQHLDQLFTEPEHQDAAVVIIAEHLYRNSTIANPALGAAACFVQLTQI